MYSGAPRPSSMKATKIEEEETPPDSPSSSGASRSSAKSVSKSFRHTMAAGMRKVGKSSALRSSGGSTLRRPAQKRSESSLLAVAEKTNHEEQKKQEDGPPPKLTHATAGRPMRGGGGARGRGGRRPPSRRPMAERTTNMESAPKAPDVSLVAAKKPPPAGLAIAANGKPVKPSAPKAVTEEDKAKAEAEAKAAEKAREKEAEAEAIEKAKQKSSMQKVGSKTVMRIFLDNAGEGSKMVAVPFPCDMYQLVEIMRKKVFTDTVGFGIFEVRSGKDVRLVDPEEDVTDVIASWKENVEFKFVFKKALGKFADLYMTPPSKEERAQTKAPVEAAQPPAKPAVAKASMPAKPTPPSKPDAADLEQGAVPVEEEPSKEQPTSTPTTPSTGRRAPPPAPVKDTTPRSSPVRRPPPALEAGARASVGAVPSKPSPQPAARGRMSANLPAGRGSRGGGSARGGPRGRGVGPGAPMRRQPSPGGQSPEPNTRRQPPTLAKPDPVPEPTQASPAPVAKPAPSPVVPTKSVPAPAAPEKPSPAAPAEPEPVAVAAAPEPVTEDGGFASKAIEEWSVEDVAAWMDELGFGKMKACFVENYISGMELVELTNNELKDDLGINALGVRKGILREIAKLKAP